MSDDINFNQLIQNLSVCNLCEDSLPLPPKPIFQLNSNAKILIIGQAPGLRTHQAEKAFDDASGVRLREWLAISDQQFYDEDTIAIMPMAFCYPGKMVNSSGDKPPPKLCEKTWHSKILTTMTKVECTILIGGYAAKQYLKDYLNLTTAIEMQKFEDGNIVLPHPSPRNNIWLSKNRWFETKTLPKVRQRVNEVLN